MDVSRYTPGAKALFSFFVIFAILATGCCCCVLTDFRTDPDYYKLDDENEKKVINWDWVKSYLAKPLAVTAALVLFSILCAMFLPTLETVPTADLEVASQPHLARYISMDVNQYTPEAKALFSFFVISAILAMGFCCYAGIDFRRDKVYYEQIDETSTEEKERKERKEEKKRGRIKWNMVRKYLKQPLAITAALVLSSSLCFSYLPTKDGRAFRPKALTVSSAPQYLSDISMDTENFTDGAQALFGCFVIALVLAVASGAFACTTFRQIRSKIADQTTAELDIHEARKRFQFYCCAFFGFTAAFSLCLVFLPTHSKETVSSSSPGPTPGFPDDLLHGPYFGGICKISHQQATAAIAWFIDEDCVEGFGLLGSYQPFHRSTLFVPDQLFRNSSNSSMYCQQTMTLANSSADPTSSLSAFAIPTPDPTASLTANSIASLANGTVTVCADICRLVSFIDTYQEQNSITGILMTFGITHVVVMLSCVAFIPAPTNQFGRIAFLAWVACILTQGAVVVVSLLSFIRAAGGIDADPFGSCLVDWNPQWKFFHVFALMAGVFQPFVIANLSILSLYSGLLIMAYRVWEYANVIQHDGDRPPENDQSLYPEDIWPVFPKVSVRQKTLSKADTEKKNRCSTSRCSELHQLSVWFAFLFYNAGMMPLNSVIFLGNACLRFGGIVVYRREEERTKKTLCYLQHLYFLLKKLEGALKKSEVEIRKSYNSQTWESGTRLKDHYPDAILLFTDAHSETGVLLEKIRKRVDQIQRSQIAVTKKAAAKPAASDTSAESASIAAGTGAAKPAVAGEEKEGHIEQDLNDLEEKIQTLEPEDVIKTLDLLCLVCKRDSKANDEMQCLRSMILQMKAVGSIFESIAGVKNYRKRIGYHSLHPVFFEFIKQQNVFEERRSKKDVLACLSEERQTKDAIAAMEWMKTDVEKALKSIDSKLKKAKELQDDEEEEEEKEEEKEEEEEEEEEEEGEEEEEEGGGEEGEEGGEGGEEEEDNNNNNKKKKKKKKTMKKKEEKKTVKKANAASDRLNHAKKAAKDLEKKLEEKLKEVRRKEKPKDEEDYLLQPLKRAYEDAKKYIQKSYSSRNLALNGHFKDANLFNLGFEKEDQEKLKGLKRLLNYDFSSEHYSHYRTLLGTGNTVQVRARYTRKNGKSGIVASHVYNATTKPKPGKVFVLDESGQIQVTFTGKGRRLGFWEERKEFETEGAKFADYCLKSTDAVGSKWFAPLFLIGLVIVLPSLVFMFVFLPQLLVPCATILLAVAGLAHLHTQILNRSSTADEDDGEANDMQDVDEKTNGEEEDQLSAREVNNKLLAVTLPYHSFWAMHFQPLYDLEQKRKLKEQNKRWEDEKKTLKNDEEATDELESSILAPEGMIAWCKYDTKKAIGKHKFRYGSEAKVWHLDMEQLIKAAKVYAGEPRQIAKDNRFAFAFQMPSQTCPEKDKEVTVHFFDIAEKGAEKLERVRDKAWCTCIGKLMHWHVLFLQRITCFC
jgi:hypothetical protein